jgi:hypothetical protein
MRLSHESSPPLIFSIPQAARKYEIPLGEIQEAIRSGELRLRRVVRSRLGLDAADVAAWLSVRAQSGAK